MENEPRFEPETPEQALAIRLKKNGVEHAETLEALMQWEDGQRELVDQAPDRGLAQIELDLKKARLYFDAGYTEAAFDSYEAAHTHAAQTGRDALAAEIKQEWEEKKK